MAVLASPTEAIVPRVVDAPAGAWVLTLTIAGYPLVAAVSGLTGVENRTLSILMRAFIVFLSLWTVLRYFRFEINRNLNTFWVAWWVFWLLYVFRLWIDSFLGLPTLKVPPWEYALFAIGACLLPALAVAMGDTQQLVKRALPLTMVTVAIALAMNLYLVFFGSAEGGDPLERLIRLRLDTETLNPIALSQLGVTLLILVAWVAKESRGISLLSRGLLLGFAALGFAAAVAGGSRGPAVSLIITLAIFVLFRLRTFISAGSALIVVSLTALAAVYSELMAETVLLTRMADELFKDDIRTGLMMEAIDAIRQHPFVGNGIEPLWTYPHNLLVESFLVTGVFGGMGFVVVLLFALRQIPVIANSNPQYFWIALLLTQYAIAAMLTGSLYMSNVFWVLLALSAALGVSSKTNRRIEGAG